MSTDVREWFHSRRFVLWDMDGPTRRASNGQLVVDGPLLSLFHGMAGNRPRPLGFELYGRVVPMYPEGFVAAAVADALGGMLRGSRDGRWYKWPTTADPFDYLRFGRHIGPEARDLANVSLTTMELSSVPTSRLATGVDRLTKRLHRLGMLQGLATNNSEFAASMILRWHGLDDGRFQTVVGRPMEGEVRLKPLPDTPLRAADNLGIRPDQRGDGVFVEDSVKNVAAGLAAGIPVLGITSHDPDKARQFLDAGAAFVIPSVRQLWIPGRAHEATALRERHLHRPATQGLRPVHHLAGLTTPSLPRDTQRPPEHRRGAGPGLYRSIGGPSDFLG